MPNAEVLISRSNQLERSLAQSGWSIAFVDVVLTVGRAKLEARIERSDGRFLLATIDALGRASVETFQRSRTLRMAAATYGRRPLSPSVDDVFLGRRSCLGAKDLLRQAASYVADNPASGAQRLTASEVRRGIMHIAGARKLDC